MITRPNSRSLISGVIGVFAFLVTSPVPSLADGIDPTIPSSQITDLLMSHGGALNGQDKDKGEKREKNEPSIKHPALRLKAIVMRDPDNGTAFLSNNDVENYVITLQRTQLQSSANAVSIGGISLMVKEFSETSLTMQTLDRTQQFIVN